MSVREKIIEESNKKTPVKKQKGFGVLLSEDDFKTINILRGSTVDETGSLLTQKNIFKAMLHLTNQDADFRQKVVELAMTLQKQ